MSQLNNTLRDKVLAAIHCITQSELQSEKTNAILCALLIALELTEQEDDTTKNKGSSKVSGVRN